MNLCQDVELCLGAYLITEGQGTVNRLSQIYWLSVANITRKIMTKTYLGYYDMILHAFSYYFRHVTKR